MIKYRIIQLYNDSHVVGFRITEQNFRCSIFFKDLNGMCSYYYTAPNGLTLSSSAQPDFHNNILHVRGHRTDMDNRISIINIKYISKIVSAINEYNELTMNRIN